MEEEVKYCKNCKRDISAKNYMIHTVHCERNIQLCNRCGEPVPRSDQEKHEEEFHSKDICSECGISVEKCQIEKHKETCIKKLVPCEYCELEVPLDNLSEHIAACGSRTEQCLKCKKHVMLKDLQKHPRYCSKKEPKTEALPCEHCDRQIDWNEFMEHTVMCGTRTERCYLCGDHVMVKDRETHLVTCEKEICAKKLVACEYCKVKFPLDYLSEHTSVCGSRKVQCPKCYEGIMLKDVEKHPRYCSRKETETIPCDYCGVQIDRDDSIEHTTMCGTHTERCLLCDEHVMIKDRDTHFQTCAKALNFSEKISCDHCGGSFDNSVIERHVKFCRSQLIKCSKCNNYIPKKDFGLHLVMCEQTNQLRPEFPCKYCGESYLSDFLESHVAKCGTRTQKCKKCDMDIALKDIETHSNVCKEGLNFSKDISCEYCEDSFSNRSIERHVEFCRSRTVKCDKCNNYILMKDRELHVTMCEQNRGSKVKYSSPCKYCGKSFPTSLLEDHTKLCISRNQKCEKCEKYISLKDIEMHLNTCKELRQLRSKLPCKYCGDLYLGDFLEDHAEKCGSRLQKCQKCNRYIALKSMETHSNECKESTSKICGECPICHESIPWIEMNVHVGACSLMSSDTHEYEHQNKLNEHTLREESGALTNKISDENKTQLHEAQRRCPFCWENFPFYFLEPHLKVCQERPYNCDRCLKAMPYHKKEEHVNRCLDRQTLAEDFLLHDEETSNNKELKKFKKCQFCDSRFPDVVLQDHLKRCENREEKCTLCLENVPVKDMQDHRLQKCNFGRGAENKNINNHTNTYAEAVPDPPKNFEKRGYLEDKVEICPSCTCKIPEERYRQHLSLCYNGETLCHFCYNRIVKRTEHSHFQNCPVVRQFVEEDKNSESKKKKGNTNKGKSLSEYLSPLTSLFSSHKGKSFERNDTQQAPQEFYPYPSNRGHIYERGNITPVHPPVTGLNEVNELPCEFCGQMWPSELLIEHESGCRPDLVCFPQTNDGNDDQKFTTASATVSHTSHTPVLGAIPKSIREEDDCKVQSRRKNQASIKDSMNYKKIERNGAQNQVNAKDRFFFYPSHDTDEVSKNQPGTFNKKRYPQTGESQETSKTKPDKEIGAKKDNSKKDEFTSFRFSAYKLDKDSPNALISKKKNDEEFSTDVKNYDEAKKSHSYSLQELSDESSPMTDYPKSNFDTKMKAVGAERTEKRRNLHSKEDVDVNKEISLQKSNTFDESNKSDPYKFLETSESRTFNPSIPALWNTEGSFSSNKALRSPLLKSSDLNEAKDESLSNAAENIEHKAFDSNMQETDYDAKNNETFGNNFVESINNQKEENDNDAKSERSNSDDTFYDADDGGAKYFDTINDNYHGSSNTEKEELSHYDFNDLNCSSRNQKENVNPSGHEDSNAYIKLEEGDFNQKDSDLDGYFQFLHYKSIKQPDCKCGNKKCCCELSSVAQKTSLQACSFKDATCSKSYSEPMDAEAFVAETKTSSQMKYKRNIEFSSKERVEDESTDFDEAIKWRKYRVPEKKVVFSSDSE